MDYNGLLFKVPISTLFGHKYEAFTTVQHVLTNKAYSKVLSVKMYRADEVAAE